MLFNSFGLAVAKSVFMLNFSCFSFYYDNSPSRTESLMSEYNAEESIVFMFSRQTDRYLEASREATSPLFSVCVSFRLGGPVRVVAL